MPLQQNLLTPRPAWLPAAFRALARHRFLTAPQLAAVADTPVVEIATALDGLVAERLFVKLHPTATLEGPRPEPAFALTRNGAKLHAVETGEPAPPIPHPRRSLFTLAHELAVTEVGIVLETLHATNAIILRRWETSREKIAASVLLYAQRRLDRVPLVADGYAVIERDGVLDGFLVECDRGTVSVARMQKKFAGYLAWSREGGPEKRFGIRRLRVLVIVPNDGRLARLRDAAIEATGGTGLISFAVQADVAVTSPERFLGAVWRAARPMADAPHALFDGVPMPGAIDDASKSDTPLASAA
jgi:hypothetical protein